MSSLRKLNKKLNNTFNGQVVARNMGGCLVLSGELGTWNDVVQAGMIAVEDNPFFGFVNDIECTGEKPMPVRTPKIEDSILEWEEPDVLIIGGGVTGCAIARELSRYDLGIILVEKEHDVAMQMSGRNLGVVQSGVGLKKTSQRFKFSRLGNAMFENLCEELEVNFTRTGQFVYQKNRLWDSFLSLTLLYWKWMGFKDVRVVGRDELRKYEPTVSNDIRAALFFPSTGVVNPFDLTIAYAENAVQNGVSLFLDTIVQSMTTEDGIIKSVVTNRGTIKPKVVINAAGVFSDYIASMAGDRFYSIHPQKGTTAVINKKASANLIQTVLTSIGKTPAKRRHTKDCCVVRSIDGPALVGPDNFETIHREDFSTSLLSIKEIFSSLSKIIPSLDEQDILAYYSGINAATYEDDFIIRKGVYTSNIIHAAGLQSPGLTSAPAVSAEVCRIVVEMFGGEDSVSKNPEFDPKRIALPRPSEMDDAARAGLIEADPDYGVIICRCEGISKGEIKNSLRRNVRCFTYDGVKRRVRATMGRCHGSCCGPRVIEIISKETGLLPHNVRKSSSGSEKLFGNPKTLLQKKISSSSRVSNRDRTDPEIIAGLHKRAELLQATKENESDNFSGS
ncbi:MAG: FAD-dependent oxidoreductase [Oscillospiraceae bacterium]|nr:FAD-dependent oxidoreductase [Oscillospiraceae bacterium]